MRLSHITVMIWVGFALTPGLGDARAGAPIRIRGGECTVAIDPDDGSLAVLCGDVPVVSSGEHGLWRLAFQDGTALDARQFRGGREGRTLTVRHDPGSTRAELSYDAPEAAVLVGVSGVPAGVELSATVRPRVQAALAFDLPARLRFDPSRLVRLVSPLTPHMGVGAAFLPRFFREQPGDRPTAWREEPSGPSGYTQMFGSGAEMRAMDAPPEPVKVTPEGQRWLEPAVARRLDGARVDAARPSRRTQVDLVLLDSPAGPILGASRFGGSGALWRWGGFVREQEAPLAAAALTGVVEHLASIPGQRRKIGLVRLRNGPDRSSGGAISVDRWANRLAPAARNAGGKLVELTTVEQMLEAVQGGEFLAILNPYGESLPVPAGLELSKIVTAIRDDVRRGGNWIETGGYSFYLALRPVRFLEVQAEYPPLFADYVHLEMGSGSLAVYRIQPRNWSPWQGRIDHAAIFIPGRTAFGGDREGGWHDRTFATFVKPGSAWQAPTVRLASGRSAQQGLEDYAVANGINRRLGDKLPPDQIDRFRKAVLVKLDGSASEMLAALPKLPVPSLIHFSDYVHGGFDKQYPDHLPPRPAFGTPAELRAVFDRAHALGHMVMPYTNPTWWCDHPRSPTFLKAGEAPLAVGLDGKPYHERYGANDGWTTTPWHPAVQAANRTLREQFTRDYPVDILFQDQCGARTWEYDTNPAEPTPFAYAEGLLSQVDEDARVKPLSTEDGFDRVLNGEVQLCGFTFPLVPGQDVAWARPFKSLFPPGSWELYPVAQVLAHDKAAMLHHDLGKFVTDRPSLAWTLALGFAMSDRVTARALGSPRTIEWLRWLDRVQKSICSRYVGEPVRSFQHEPGLKQDDDGLVRAEYGPVRLVANLGPEARPDHGRTLPGWGFLAIAPGLIAGNVQGIGGVDFGPNGAAFVVEGDSGKADVWVLSRPGQTAGCLVPLGMTGHVGLTLDGQLPRNVTVQDGAVTFTVPARAGTTGDAPYVCHGVVKGQ